MTVHLAGSSADTIASGDAKLASLVRMSLYVAVITAIVALAAYAVLAQLAPRYRAEATVLIGVGEPVSKRIGVAPPVGRGLPEDVASAQLQLVRSPDLARTVVQSLGLERRPGVHSALGGESVVSDVLSGIGLRRDPMRSSPEERLLEVFAANLSVSAMDDAPAIAIGFTANDPRLAAAVANAVAAEYVALQHAAAEDSGDEAAGWLEAEIGSLTRRIEAIENKVRAYRAGIEQVTGSGPLAADPARQQRARTQLRNDLRELENEAARQRSLLASYEQRYRDALARQQSGMLPVDARILSRASPPAEPTFPNKALLTAIVGGFALLAMTVVFIVRGLGRSRQRDRTALVPLPEVAHAVPFRVAAERWSDDRGVRRMMPSAPTFADTEVGGGMGDSLAAIVPRLIADGAKRILVVTTGDEVGKCRPLAAVALARAFARADRRPVLIDLRDDGADSMSMGEAADLPGFSDLFAGEASFGQVIFRDRQSRVHFIPAGRLRLPRQELTDERVGSLVSVLDHTYDHVVFDVANDLVEMIGSGCDAAVVASTFDRDDPRTTDLVDLVRAHSPARIVVLRVDAAAGKASVRAIEPVAGGAAA